MITVVDPGSGGGDLNITISTLEKRISQIRSTTNELNAKIAAANSGLSQLSQAKAEIYGEINNQKNLINNQTTTVNNAKKAMDQAKSNYDDVYNKYNYHLNQVNAWNNKQANLETQLHTGLRKIPKPNLNLYQSSAIAFSCLLNHADLSIQLIDKAYGNFGNFANMVADLNSSLNDIKTLLGAFLTMMHTLQEEAS